MEMRKVDSSNIDAIRWEKGNLIVHFSSGRIYSFKKVPQIIFNNFLEAESKGKFFNKNIQKKFEYEREDNV